MSAAVTIPITKKSENLINILLFKNNSDIPYCFEEPLLGKKQLESKHKLLEFPNLFQ